MATFASLYWDPAVQPSGYTITFLGLVYDRLVHTAPDGSLVPGLAESWEYGDDGSTLTFHLRDGVTFQDGAPFDAAAVKANLDRSMTLETSTVKPDLARIAEVVVADPQTVQLNLASPDATLPAGQRVLQPGQVQHAAARGALPSVAGDPDEREGVLQDVSREVVDQVLDMPLFFAREPVAVSERVVGFVPYVTGRPDYRTLGVTP